MALVKKKQIVFLNFILLQMFFSCFIALSYMQLQICGWHSSVVVIFFVVVFLGILCVWTVKELLRLAKKENEAEVALARLEENQALVQALKVKQHDFANHIQVIHGLIYQGKMDQLSQYMKNVTADLKVLDRLTKLKSPELVALISKKMVLSDPVKVEPVIETDLAHLNVPGDKIVSILGNLLDNAIYALQNDSFTGFQTVSLRISEEEGRYIFQVWNPGYIAEELQEKIFQPGFSTKGDQGSGMGLYIVKNLVSEYGGSIDFGSDPQKGTSFAVAFPFREPSVNEAAFTKGS